MSSIYSTLKQKIDEAEKRLKQLYTLIETAKIAGLDTTIYETRIKDLEQKIQRWKEAVEHLERSL